jgi:transketolase C-terminal domain/subunit
VAYLETLGPGDGADRIRSILLDEAREMHLDVTRGVTAPGALVASVGPVLTTRVPPRPKAVHYDADALPRIDPSRQYSASDVVTAAMKVFSRDGSVVSIDADLASTSGLEAGVAAVDQQRAFNVGVAEANMMLVGEAFAVLGFNAWVSTFCPFFNWQVMRRIAVGHQERLESIASPEGWLSEGHGLDLTFLATAANFETRTNGATHMGNDDATTLDGVAHLKIIDVSCPQQMLAVMRWIMAGNRGLVYVRVMRTPSAVIHDPDQPFEFGRAYVVRDASNAAPMIVSSGRQVHESLGAAALLSASGLEVGVVDMPSIDEEWLVEACQAGRRLVFAEQNNGSIWDQCQRLLHRHRRRIGSIDFDRFLPVNTLRNGRPWFIHSATYEELIARFELSPAALADTIRARLPGAA